MAQEQIKENPNEPSDEMVEWVRNHLASTGMFEEQELALPSRVHMIRRIAYYFDMNDFSVEEMERLYDGEDAESQSADVILLFDFARVSHDTFATSK